MKKDRHVKNVRVPQIYEWQFKRIQKCDGDTEKNDRKKNKKGVGQKKIDDGRRFVDRCIGGVGGHR